MKIVGVIFFLTLFSCIAQEPRLSNYSNKELFGQMVMLGVKEKQLSEDESRWLSSHGIGSVLLLSRNIPETANELAEILLQYQNVGKKQRNQHPLLISIDQENGWISRLQGIVTELPNNYALGKLNDTAITRNVAEMSGKELKSLGIHWSLSPVADVNSNPKNPIIGVRSFGESAERVKAHAMAYVAGLNNASVFSSIKHFPGHGDTGFDSHSHRVSIDKNLKELTAIDLVPFSFLGEPQRPQPTSVMIGHIQLPQIDASEKPATLSEPLIGLIPKGYQGLLIADELEMSALAKFYNPYASVVEMIENGMDVIIMARALKQRVDVDSLFNFIDAYANQHPRFRKQLERSAQNVLDLKNQPVAMPDTKRFQELKQIHKKIALRFFKQVPYAIHGKINPSKGYRFSTDSFTQAIVKNETLVPSSKSGYIIQFIKTGTEPEIGDLIISIENPYILANYKKNTFCFYNRYAPKQEILNQLFKKE